MPQENEKCCSYSRTGAVKFSFQLSRNKLSVSEGLTAVPSIQIAFDGLSPLAPSVRRVKDRTKPGRLIREELIICAAVAGVSNGELYAR